NDEGRHHGVLAVEDGRKFRSSDRTVKMRGLDFCHPPDFFVANLWHESKPHLHEAFNSAVRSIEQERQDEFGALFADARTHTEGAKRLLGFAAPRVDGQFLEDLQKVVASAQNHASG